MFAECSSIVFFSQRLNWLIRGQPARGSNVTILSKNSDEGSSPSSISSTIVVRGLEAAHSGEWTCVLSNEVRAADGTADTEIRQRESTNVLVNQALVF